ncbi:MAG: energy-coupling factor transporter transmembrane protein EcfT [Treponema sp.]|jgi:cobalt/nickel transport system permease protein|nr:energy-coupling factor transporter transmembrane protein EcfT [Treponema sp.]
MYPDRLEFKNDPLKAFDPRCRLASGAVFIFAVLYITDTVLLACLTVSPALLLSRDIKALLPRLSAVNLFCAMLFVTMPLGGEPLSAALLYTLRINAAALLSMFFVVSMGIGNLIPALSKLGAPGKLVSLLMLTYRYLFVIHRQVFYSVLSIRLRRPRQSMTMTWHSYAAAFASVFAGAFFRSQKVKLAARARGFDGVFPLTRTFRWKARDSLASAGAALAAILLLFANAALSGGM